MIHPPGNGTGPLDPSSYFQGLRRPSIPMLGNRVGVDGYGKETGIVGARAHRPPDPLAPLEEWQSYRAGLDALEARLLVSHPLQRSSP